MPSSAAAAAGVTYGFCGFTTGTGDGLMVGDPTPLAVAVCRLRPMCLPQLLCSRGSCPPINWVGAGFLHVCLLQVAEEFTRLKPRNPLARFIPALKKLAGKGDRFTGLEGFEDEVRKLKSDPGG